MQVSAIQCPDCKDTIFSRAHHDFHYCSCGNCFIDGGTEYTRVGANDLSTIKQLTIEVDATPSELYDDWNMRIDKFGIIKS